MEAQRELAESPTNTETLNSRVGRWSHVPLALQLGFFPLHHTAHAFPAAMLSCFSLKLFYGQVVLFSKYKAAHDRTVVGKIWNQSFPGKSCMKDHCKQTAMTSLPEPVTFLPNVWPRDPKSWTLSPRGWHVAIVGLLHSPYFSVGIVKIFPPADLLESAQIAFEVFTSFKHIITDRAHSLWLFLGWQSQPFRCWAMRENGECLFRFLTWRNHLRMF